jgi:hypothetical protein
MTAFDFVVGLIVRGVRFTRNGDRLAVHDLEGKTSALERAVIASLAPTIDLLVMTDVPIEQTPPVCSTYRTTSAFSEFGPVERPDDCTSCTNCGHSRAAHFWGGVSCATFLGNPEPDALCLLCNAPSIEHIEASKNTDTP